MILPIGRILPLQLPVHICLNYIYIAISAVRLQNALDIYYCSYTHVQTHKHIQVRHIHMYTICIASCIRFCMSRLKGTTVL